MALMLFVPTAMAWGASSNVAAVDDESNTNANWVYSANMYYVYYSDYSSVTMTTVEPGDVNAVTLGNYDTLFLFACDPTVFSASQKTDIVNFVKNGGKLIIWDAEDPYYLPTGPVWDYSWLPTPFLTAVPGAMGAQGTLTIVEENMLSTTDPSDLYFIDANVLSTGTDAVGDANVFTSFIPEQWCVDCMAENYLDITGPTHVYTDSSSGDVGNGIIIYSGLDWDYAGYGLSQGAWLKKMLKQEFEASSLPCGSVPPTNIDVTKVSDKTDYTVGETVTFTVTVTNPATNPYTAENVVLTDYPPDEVTLSPTTFNLGDIDPGDSVVTVITGTADQSGCDLENSAVAVGYYGQYPVFSGGDTVTFNIDCTGPSPTPIPEFATIALPVASILGLLFFFNHRKRREEN